MKKIVIPIILFITFISCMDNPKNVETASLVEEQLTLEGTWEMMGYYNYQDNKVIDSFTKGENFRQVKIYTPTKVMWSKKVPTDSTEWFGYGSYKLSDTSLTEILDYGSKMMNQVIEERMEFKYELILDKDKFTQIELDEDGNRIYSENYVRIE